MASSQTHMAIAPQTRRERRPNFSIAQKEIGVLPTLTIVVIMDTKKALFTWMDWKKVTL